jgi:lipopolysaccharide/colanic/teichoic acid biosynthesis glycosyltransferase
MVPFHQEPISETEKERMLANAKQVVAREDLGSRWGFGRDVLGGLAVGDACHCACRPMRAVRCACFVQCLEKGRIGLEQLETPARSPRWKRILDLTCILLLIPVWGLVMLALAALVKCVSSGPVFFRQERVGFKGRPFTLLKFRTMKTGSDVGVHQNHFEDLVRSGRAMVKMDALGDRRLIPFGGLLRSAGLDELPQILNVLRGDMSLVGPRPCTTYEYSLYSDWQKKRFATLPGLTGLWQVCGKNNTTFNQMIYLDTYYARHSSLAMDLRIMLRTVHPIFQQVREFAAGRRRQRKSEKEVMLALPQQQKLAE